MEKIKFVMTDTGAQVSAACRQALEAKGVAVTVCEKSGRKALDTLLEQPPWRNLQVVNTFLEQRRLDALFSVPTATVPVPKQRF